MTFRQAAVDVVCNSENDRARNCHGSVRHQADLVMSPGGANDQQNHANATPQKHPRVAMSFIACDKCDGADWQNKRQHLQMEMARRKLLKKRYGNQDKRQGNAVKHAQPGQPDRNLVQCSCRVG